MASIVAVCTSEKKGERKREVAGASLLVNVGIEGDAHAGFAHRQVSLLGVESIRKMRDRGLDVGPGDFAENLTVEGIDLPALPVGTRLRLGRGPHLRVTQIGKECHARCEIFRQAGDCVMPREGIFAEVLMGGEVCPGDAIRVLPNYRFGVITASDRGTRGERVDLSGPLAREILMPWGDVAAYRLVPDELMELAAAMAAMAAQGLDLVVTTGGTGLSPRDVTPEATMQVIERVVPGVAEAMRAAGREKTPHAMLSRGVAGISGRTLIVNLPGSPRGVQESLSVLTPVLEHALELVNGRGGECGGGSDM